MTTERFAKMSKNYYFLIHAIMSGRNDILLLFIKPCNKASYVSVGRY
ncbi:MULTISPECIES: hypothetical protein [unclassified Rickettsia]